MPPVRTTAATSSPTRGAARQPCDPDIQTGASPVRMSRVHRREGLESCQDVDARSPGTANAPLPAMQTAVNYLSAHRTAALPSSALPYSARLAGQSQLLSRLVAASLAVAELHGSWPPGWHPRPSPLVRVPCGLHKRPTEYSTDVTDDESTRGAYTTAWVVVLLREQQKQEISCYLCGGP